MYTDMEGVRIENQNENEQKEKKKTDLIQVSIEKGIEKESNGQF